MDETPLLTMTKSRIIDEMPELNDKSTMLFQTLSTLCSFHTCEDLASFLFSDMFRDLVAAESPWIVFEIGVYRDHTITMEAIPTVDGIKFADASMKGAIPDNLVDVKTEKDASTILTSWFEGNING